MFFCVLYIRQSCSSSSFISQSFLWSQTLSRGIHLPDLHWNSPSVHLGLWGSYHRLVVVVRNGYPVVVLVVGALVVVGSAWKYILNQVKTKPIFKKIIISFFSLNKKILTKQIISNIYLISIFKNYLMTNHPVFTTW